MSETLHFLLVGATAGFGALIPEVLRWVACFRANRPPKGYEWVASILMVLLSAVGVAWLFDTNGLSSLQLAIFGAAFPQTFSSAVAAFSKPDRTTRGHLKRRRISDYLAWRIG